METKELQLRIRELLKKRNAILLAHNYQRPEVQEVADLCGDSLELSIKASRTDAEVIIFCGVQFMAETASILCPDKKVILPVRDAGCPMADMINARQLREKKQEMPDALVVSYVNTTAEVKAESDICCTSANVLKVVDYVEPSRPIYMTPDRNLARYAKEYTGRRNLDWWDGYCPVHDALTVECVKKVKEEHPDALFIAHPECRIEILRLADAIKSTSGMIRYAKESEHKKFIIGTEIGILHPLQKACPDKLFIPADPDMICSDMKKTGLLEILNALERLEPEIKVPEEIRKMAISAVDRMLSI